MAIKDLQYELAKVCKAHEDILATYSAKLKEYGISETELGFQPLRTRMVSCKIETGTASLLYMNPQGHQKDTLLTKRFSRK